jgi:hypothetical protein
MNPLENQPLEFFIQPETELEAKIVMDESWREGASWRLSHWAHPEGRIIYHIQEVLANINKLTLSDVSRERLRLVAIIHDSFKHLEIRGMPRVIAKHHAILAYRFAKRYINDELILNMILLHDHAFYAWKAFKYENLETSDQLIRHLENAFQIPDQMQDFYNFFICDTYTGHKNPEPLHWFMARVPYLTLQEIGYNEPIRKIK